MTMNNRALIQNLEEFHARSILLSLRSTCYETRLARHLKVCNAKRLADEQPSYIVKGINLGDTDEKLPEHVPLSKISQSLIDSVIAKVEAAYERLPVVTEEILCEEILNEEIANESYGHGLRKHLLQNASLLAHVKAAGLAQDNTCFIEFGAGKGKLTYWLAQTIIDKTGSSVLLIDRSSHRHKSDNKLKNVECPINVSRIRADIGDLRLSGVPEIRNIDRIVGIAKHLCGAATETSERAAKLKFEHRSNKNHPTVHPFENGNQWRIFKWQPMQLFPTAILDLTIRCLIGLMNDEPKSRISGLIVAFCCHHRCDYSSYVGKEYLRNCGFVKDEFPILCSIASWATCATGKNRNVVVRDDEEQNRKIAEREMIGRKVKSLLNWGRIEYLRNLGFDSNLVYYTTSKVSLENMCMIAVLKKT